MVAARFINLSASSTSRKGSPRLSSRTLQNSQRGARQTTVDPGDEPALSLDGRRAPDRRRVNLRWLVGAVLTGFSGAALMGGAVFAALDGEYSMARLPAVLAASGLIENTGNDVETGGARKADKAVMQSLDLSARQTIRISTTTKVGDNEVIKVKPFALVMANLALSRGSLASEVPNYNPTKIFAEANPEQAVEPEPIAADDGEVSVATRELATVDVKSEAGLTLRMEQVRALVQEQASFEAQAVSISVPPQLLAVGLEGAPEAPATGLAYSIDGVDSRSALDVRIVPENVTELGKTRAAGDDSSEERTIVVEKDGSLDDILASLGANQTEISQIRDALGNNADLRAGQRLRVLATPSTQDPERAQPARISIYTATQHEATVALSDNGGYVGVADPASTDVAGNNVDDDQSGPGIPLYYSIYETALKQKVEKRTIEDLLRVYAYDVDLNRKTRPGDTFEVFYEVDDNGEPQGDVLYTSLNVGGDLKRYYRFVTPDDGTVDYYDESGRSARKFLMRKPMNGGEQRSPFGMRKHPILGYWKMHTGVDWAGPIGTPIVASGNGVVVKAAWSSGYGRRVEIQHQNGYVTTYSHMSGFGPGMKPGVKVSMGQVVGYLGSSGLSTGPHLHYEVKINGNFVDPMRIRLPQGRELDGRLLAAFKEQRDKIDSMMSSAPMARNNGTGSDKGA